jgi:hypothetical protein
MSAEQELFESSVVNREWHDFNHKIRVTGEGRELTLQECYDRDIQLSQEIFNEVSSVADLEIPPNKYILFVDMVNPGSMGSPQIQSVDPDRLAKVYEAETGDSDINQDFSSANMRHCFGFRAGDVRFVTVKPFLRTCQVI